MKKAIADIDLEQIRQKLNYLGSAVMYNLGGHPEYLPNNLVRLLCMDNQGNLWFSIKPSHTFIGEPGLSFPAHFCFYRKEAGFYAMAEGTAHVSEPETGKETSHTLLIRLNPAMIEFTEYGSNTAWLSLFTKWWDRFYSRFNLALIGKKHRALRLQVVPGKMRD